MTETVRVPEEVRPPAYRVAPRVRRVAGYVWAPVVLAGLAAVSGVVSWVVGVAR